MQILRQSQSNLLELARGIKDLIFGNTINAVRHHVSAPVLVVGAEPLRS